jgi:hypothetical protein
VREGAADAPGMDAEAELRTLRARYDSFRRDFKLRLEATAELLRRAEREERRSARHLRSSRDPRGGGGAAAVGAGAHGAAAEGGPGPGGRPADAERPPDKPKTGILSSVMPRLSSFGRR